MADNGQVDGQFVAVLADLGKVVVLAGIVERVMAFIFEYEWFGRLFTRPADTGAGRVSRFPGLKAALTLSFSLGITYTYGFDLLSTLFGTESATVGLGVTGFVIAGGSAGAIALFQAHLKFGKETRDATVAAANAATSLREEEAKQKKAEAEAAAAEADLRRAKAEAQAAQVRSDTAGG